MSPIPSRRRPSQARAQVTREAILDATLQVLLRDGYAALTTTRVADRAGVSVGSLYQYFADKRELTLALVDRYVGAMHEAVAQVVDPADPSEVEPTLRRALAALLAVKLTRLDLVVALRTPMVELGGLSAVQASLSRFAALFAPLVGRALGAQAPPEVIARKAMIAVTAIEGAITAVAHSHPEWLGEAWFLDEITALGTATLRLQAPASGEAASAG